MIVNHSMADPDTTGQADGKGPGQARGDKSDLRALTLNMIALGKSGKYDEAI